MSNRQNRTAIARRTLDICEQGFYQNTSGEKVEIRNLLDVARENTRHYEPEDFPKIFAERDRLLQEQDWATTKFMVREATTLEAAHDLAEDGRICVLNFASAKNPGGGFLGGARAQEESLARSSGLYPCINRQQKMYNTNRACGTCLYTDHLLYSPDVPVFCTDEGDLLEQPYLMSVLTVPAVNRGAIQPRERSQVEPTMCQRIENLLSVAIVENERRLILGAWGCGVFRNDPEQVADWFARQLLANPVYKNAFDLVMFAIFDHTDDRGMIRPFESRFQS